MKITDVKPIHLRVPAKGEDCLWGYDAFLVEVHTDEGIIGVGESDTSPEVARACILADKSNWHCTGLKELLVGENPLEIERLWDKMFWSSNYFGRVGAGLHAMSAIDIALWDIASQYYKTPIHMLLGGKFRDKIEVYGTIEEHRGQPIEKTIDTVLEKKAAGWKNLKCVSFCSNKEEAARLTRLREALGYDVGLAVDALTHWKNFTEAARMCKALEPLDLNWIEEPVLPDDYSGYSKLSGLTRNSISGGEGLAGRLEFKQFIEQGRPDIIQPDITRVGGITEMRRIHDFAQLHAVRLIPHDYSTPILISASVQFLAATNDGDMFEYCQGTSPLLEKLCTNKIPFENGYVKVPDCIGLGLEFDQDIIKKYEVKY